MEPPGSTVHVRSWIEWVGLTCCTQQTHSCPRNLCRGPSPWLQSISTTSFLGLENVPLYLFRWNIELTPQIQWLKKYKMLVIPPSFAGMVQARHTLELPAQSHLLHFQALDWELMLERSRIWVESIQSGGSSDGSCHIPRGHSDDGSNNSNHCGWCHCPVWSATATLCFCLFPATLQPILHPSLS